MKNQGFFEADPHKITTKISIRKGSTRRKGSGEKSKYWVITEEGMKKYQEITNDDVGLGDMSNYEEPFDAWKDKVDEVMHLCFQKKTVNRRASEFIQQNSKSGKVREILREIEKRGKIQREIVKEFRVFRKSWNYPVKTEPRPAAETLGTMREQSPAQLSPAQPDPVQPSPEFYRNSLGIIP